MSNIRNWYKRIHQYIAYTLARGEHLEEELDAIQSSFEKIPELNDDGTEFTETFGIKKPTQDNHPVQYGQIKHIEQQLANIDSNAQITSEQAQTAIQYGQAAKDIAVNLIKPDGYKYIGRCKSIAELRTIKPTYHSQRILVDAYYEGGTTGGGEFVADLQDMITPDDSGVCFVVENNGGRWKRVGNQLSIDDIGYTSGDLLVHSSLANTPLNLLGKNINVSVVPNISIYNGVITINAQSYLIPQYPVKLTAHQDVEADGTIIKYSNFSIGIDAANNLIDNDENYANTAVGTSAMQNVTTVKRVTAIGTSAARDIKQGYSLTAIGTNALKWTNYADRNTVIGENAGVNLGSETPDVTHGYFNGRASDVVSKIIARYPNWKEKYNQGGKSSIKMTADLYESKASRNVAVGRNAMGFSITGVNNVAIGYDALTSAIDGGSNVAIGARVMQLSVDANTNVAVGGNSLANSQDVQQVTALGYDTAKNYPVSKQNVAIGYQALLGTKTSDTDEATNNVAIGRLSMGNSGGNIKFNVGIGGFSLSEVSGGVGNTAIGHRAGGFITSGNYNTALGYDALRYVIGGADNDGRHQSFDYCTGVGWGASVTGSRQLQLGSPDVTTYSYGAVQNRSDERDKADIRDTVLGLDFINALRPVDFKWDYRDSYISVDDDGNISPLPKDGSKKGVRYHHGFIAQDVARIIETNGIDFGGYQDHKVNGGSDVKSLGYEEFIAPLVKAVQELSSEIKKINQKIN